MNKAKLLKKYRNLFLPSFTYFYLQRFRFKWEIAINLFEIELDFNLILESDYIKYKLVYKNYNFCGSLFSSSSY